MENLFDSTNPLDSEAPPQATHDRTYGVPAGPRVFVPPPMLNSAEAESAMSRKFMQAEVNTSINNIEFVRTHTGNWQPTPQVLDWKYAQRHEAQGILPFLFLGPLAAAKNKAWLVDNQITMVLSVRKTDALMAKVMAPKAPHELGILMAHIDVLGNQQLIGKFQTAIDIINEHLSEKYEAWKANHQNNTGRVLVFCESGNERAAAVVAAYIMAMYNFNAIQAIQSVQAHRFCVSLDDDLRFLLTSYEAILKARRDVKVQDQANGNGNFNQIAAMEDGRRSHLEVPAQTSGLRKRKDIFDDEEEMEDASDGESSSFRREGSAPFFG